MSSQAAEHATEVAQVTDLITDILTANGMEIRKMNAITATHIDNQYKPQLHPPVTLIKLVALGFLVLIAFVVIVLVYLYSSLFPLKKIKIQS